MFTGALLLSLAAPALALDAAVLADGLDRVVDDALALTLTLALDAPRRAQDAPAEAPVETPDQPPDERKSAARKKSDAALDAPLPAAGSASTPQGRAFGVGLQLGYPTSVTAKYMLQPEQGLVFGIGGFSAFAYDAPAVSVHVDYVYHPSILTSSNAFAVTWYIGGGGNIFIYSNPRQRSFVPNLPYYRSSTLLWLAARVPIGVSLAMQQQPFEIYLEAVPSVLLFPGVGFGLGASIGARFYL